MRTEIIYFMSTIPLALGVWWLRGAFDRLRAVEDEKRINSLKRELELKAPLVEELCKTTASASQVEAFVASACSSLEQAQIKLKQEPGSVAGFSTFTKLVDRLRKSIDKLVEAANAAFVSRGQTPLAIPEVDSLSTRVKRVASALGKPEGEVYAIAKSLANGRKLADMSADEQEKVLKLVENQLKGSSSTSASAS